MQCEKPRANEWGKSNLVCITKEKTFEAKPDKKKKKKLND
jgi:hypothetical protein